MYKKADRNQLSIEEFYLPFGGQLTADNRWVGSPEKPQTITIRPKSQRAKALRHAAAFMANTAIINS